jgi:uncharacterized protein YbbC (DUF1343 family)
MKKAKVLSFLIALLPILSVGQSNRVITGAERMEVYLPMLKDKHVAVFANQTSVVGNSHLVDTLVKAGIKIVKIFGPEHGFRGIADAGEHVKDGIDKKSGLPVISLYGIHKKPTLEDLKDVDVVVFDIQDVGVRFYTFISSLEYVLEACLENHKPLLVLDRPNPNGFYVDGPVQANKNYRYKASIENKVSLTFLLKIIPCKNYDHITKYNLPINPSPNLREMQSIYLYPSTCFFEGTVISEGRGTDKPFQIFGHPSLPKNLYYFTPMPNEGAKVSKCFNQLCFGWNLSDTKENVLKNLNGRIQLKYLIEAYKLFPKKDSFFLTNNFFNKLAGNDVLMKQIKAGKTEKEIKKSWEKGLMKFKPIRKKYLLYKDF